MQNSVFRSNSRKMNILPQVLLYFSGAAILLAGCDQQNTTQPTTTSAPSVASTPAPVPSDWKADTSSTLTASPNPVSVAGAMGSTTITWNAPGRQNAAVYVATDGGAETLFAQGPSGSSPAPWVQVGPTYDFRLYSSTSRTELLSRLVVTGQK